MFGNGLLTRHTLIYQCCKSIDLASSQVIHTLDDFSDKISSLALSFDFGENLVQTSSFLLRNRSILVEIGHFEGWMKWFSNDKIYSQKIVLLFQLYSMIICLESFFLDFNGYRINSIPYSRSIFEDFCIKRVKFR